MNTPEVIAAIAAPCVLGFAALMLVASAKEWVNISVTMSLKFIPAAKRQPRTAVDVRVIPVISGTAETVEVPKIGAARGHAG